MLPWISRLAALVLLSVPALAENTLQLMLAGQAGLAGSAVDIEIEVRSAQGTEAPLASLHVSLLPLTTAADLAALLDARLTQARIPHVAPAPSSERNRATLFVDGVTRVLVRVSDGLKATIGLLEGAPTSVQLLPPLARRGGTSLDFHGVTHDARLRQRGVVDFSVALQADSTATQAVELLANACARANWLSERPSHETWKPSPSYEGLELVGTSLALDTAAADWGLELRLP